MCEFDQDKYTHDWIVRSLNRLMWKYGYTPEVLAEFSGYAPSSIRAIANGSRGWKGVEKFVHMVTELAKDGNIMMLKDMLPEVYSIIKSESSVQINLSIDDEISDLSVPIARMKVAKENDDAESYFDALGEFWEIGHRLEQEGKAIR